MDRTHILSASSSRPLSSTVTTTKWFWLIMTVGVLVRLYRLDSQSLWADEGLQYFVASADSITGVFDRMTRTFHPPLSFVINHLFLQLGNSDFFLRLPSMLFGIGSLWLCYTVARRVTCPATAVFTTLVLAISPFHIWYSQDGRMYAQLLFFSLLSTVLLLRALEQEKWQWWGGYVLVVTAGMYSHILMALGVLAQGLWVLLVHRRHLLAYCSSGILIAVLYLPLIMPWVRFFVRRVSPSEVKTAVEVGERLGFSWMALPYTFFAYSAGFSLGPSVAELHEKHSITFLWQFLPSIAVVGILYGALLVIGIRAVYKQFSPQFVLLCLLGLGIPFIVLIVLSLLTRFTFNARYTIVAFPYFCLFVGAALAFLWSRKPLLGTVTSLMLIGLCAVSLVNHFYNSYYAKENLRAAVALWRHSNSHEPLLSVGTAGGTRDAINRYLQESERPHHIPLGGSKDSVKKIRDFFSTHPSSSVYVVLARDWRQVRERAIRQAFPISHEQTLPGVKVLRISSAP